MKKKKRQSVVIQAGQLESNNNNPLYKELTYNQLYSNEESKVTDSSTIDLKILKVTNNDFEVALKELKNSTKYNAVDLKEVKFTDIQQLKKFKEVIDNNQLIGNVIWGELPPEFGGIKGEIDNKIKENNLHYRPFPTDFEYSLLCAHISEEKYGNDVKFTSPNKRHYNDFLCGWKIHTIIHDKIIAQKIPEYEATGYYAVVYKKGRQLVLVHKAFDDGIFSALNKDNLRGALGNNIISKVAIAYIVTQEFVEYARKNNCHFSATGYKDAAWLTELVAFFAYNDFNYLAKVVTFESLGTHNIFEKLNSNINSKFAFNHADLDITTYNTKPNLFNCCNKQSATAFSMEIDKNLSKIDITKSKIKGLALIKALQEDLLSQIIASFDPITGKPKSYKQIKKWPILESSGIDDGISNIIGGLITKVPFSNFIPNALTKFISNKFSEVARSLLGEDIVTPIIDLFSSIISGNIKIKNITNYYELANLTNKHSKFKLKYEVQHELLDISEYVEILNKSKDEDLINLAKYPVYLSDVNFSETASWAIEQLKTLKAAYLIKKKGQIKVIASKTMKIEEIRYRLARIYDIFPEFAEAMTKEKYHQRMFNQVQNSETKLDQIISKQEEKDMKNNTSDYGQELPKITNEIRPNTDSLYALDIKKLMEIDMSDNNNALNDDNIHIRALYDAFNTGNYFLVHLLTGRVNQMVIDKNDNFMGNDDQIDLFLRHVEYWPNCYKEYFVEQDDFEEQDLDNVTIVKEFDKEKLKKHLKELRDGARQVFKDNNSFYEFLEYVVNYCALYSYHQHNFTLPIVAMHLLFAKITDTAKQQELSALCKNKFKEYIDIAIPDGKKKCDATSSTYLVLEEKAKKLNNTRSAIGNAIDHSPKAKERIDKIYSTIIGESLKITESLKKRLENPDYVDQFCQFFIYGVGKATSRDDRMKQIDVIERIAIESINKLDDSYFKDNLNAVIASKSVTIRRSVRNSGESVLVNNEISIVRADNNNNNELEIEIISFEESVWDILSVNTRLSLSKLKEISNEYDKSKVIAKDARGIFVRTSSRSLNPKLLVDEVKDEIIEESKKKEAEFKEKEREQNEKMEKMRKELEEEKKRIMEEKNQEIEKLKREDKMNKSFRSLSRNESIVQSRRGSVAEMDIDQLPDDELEALIARANAAKSNREFNKPAASQVAQLGRNRSNTKSEHTAGVNSQRSSANEEDMEALTKKNMERESKRRSNIFTISGKRHQ